VPTSGPIGSRLMRMPDKGWQRRFDDPIPLPRGHQLVTLERGQASQLSFRNQDRNLRSHRRLVLCVTGTKRTNAHDEIQNYRSRRTFACTRGSGNGS
jgi:hypothetical protein